MTSDAGAVGAGIGAVAAASLGEVEADTARVAAFADATEDEQLDGGTGGLARVILVSESRAAGIPAQAGSPGEPVEEGVVTRTRASASRGGAEQLADRVAKRMEPEVGVQRIDSAATVGAERVCKCERLHGYSTTWTGSPTWTLPGSTTNASSAIVPSKSVTIRLSTP